MNKTLNFQVSGMHCQSCEMLVKEELDAVSGIKNVLVDHKTGKGSLTLTNGHVKNDQIITAIKNAGYSAIIGDEKLPSPSFNQITLPPEIQIDAKIGRDADGQFSVKGRLIFAAASENSPVPLASPSGQVSATSPNGVSGRTSLVISGMHCSSCAGLIERQLKKVPGVTSANVNFAAEKATVIYDPAVSKLEDLVKAVEKAGYKGSPESAEGGQSQSERQQADIKHQWNKFIVSFVLSAPMIYFMSFDFFSFNFSNQNSLLS